MADSFHVFETAAGWAAIAWRGAAVTGFRLPATTAAESERAVKGRHPGVSAAMPRPAIAKVIADARRYFAGENADFANVQIDLGRQEPTFDRVYAHVRRLGRGETTTYGAVAKALALGPEFARDVGQAMARNPVPLIIPCHRVLGAGGKLGGFSAPGGSEAKRRMLEMEGVVARDDTQPTFAF